MISVVSSRVIVKLTFQFLLGGRPHPSENRPFQIFEWALINVTDDTPLFARQVCVLLLRNIESQLIYVTLETGNNISITKY